jgi:hypothetical protein
MHAMKQPKITQSHNRFSLTCSVEIYIHATAERIWSILTDAADHARWNSTVARMEGEIVEGSRLKLWVPGEARTFRPKVSGVVANERMTWTGGFAPLFKGVRTFTLRPNAAGATEFTMTEHFTGLILPLVARKLPDFGPIFKAYAEDLKREVE